MSIAKAQAELADIQRRLKGEDRATIPPTHSILLNIGQVCMFLGGVSESKVWSMLSAGTIPAPKKIDGLTRWLRSELEEWSERL